MSKTENYLKKSTDLLCRAVYEACRENFSRKSHKPYDVKLLKETCSAVKEAAALVSGLEKRSSDTEDTVKIIFTDGEEYKD